MKYAPSVPIVALLALCAGAFLPLEDAKAAADPGPSPSANAGAAAAPTAAAETVPFTVDTKQFVFAPTPLTVPAGSTVVFKNSDSVAHTVTAPTDRSIRRTWTKAKLGRTPSRRPVRTTTCARTTPS